MGIIQKIKDKLSGFYTSISVKTFDLRGLEKIENPEEITALVIKRDPEKQSRSIQEIGGSKYISAPNGWLNFIQNDGKVKIDLVSLGKKDEYGILIRRIED